MNKQGVNVIRLNAGITSIMHHFPSHTEYKRMGNTLLVHFDFLLIHRPDNERHSKTLWRNPYPKSFGRCLNGGRTGEVDVDRLDFGVVGQGVFTELPTDTRLLESTERHVVVQLVVAYEKNELCFQYHSRAATYS